ncbi:UNVERIFIED_CONTAM: hypothetical protein Scaly_1607700 [Sesamum calycinum]|uniref:DUF7792 domain-containing protein n=2 Tax=Sesamum TaxID=4181 RepID=A0AAW2P816_9LAMI
MGDLVMQILAAPTQLTDQVIKAADAAAAFKQECAELKSKTEKLVRLLQQAAHASNDFYERPMRRIMDEIEQVLKEALALVFRCGRHGWMKPVLTIIPATAFRKMSLLLEYSIADVSWLLRLSGLAEARDEEYNGLPPFAATDPVLFIIWEQIALLYTDSADDRSDAAASLVCLVRDNDRCRKLIIQEGGVGPLFKLVKEGKSEEQENAARAIGLLGKDAGVCSVIAEILKEGPMKVQAVVASAVSELAAHYPKCQDLFAQHNIIRLLVSHLSFETVQEHSKYAVISKWTSMHAAEQLASSNNNSIAANESVMKGSNDLDEDKSSVPHPLGTQQSNQMYDVVTNTMAMNAGRNPVKSNATNCGKVNSVHSQPSLFSLSGANNRAREMEYPATKAYIKAMAAKALWHLAKGNSPICRSITETRALLCFAVLLEKGAEEVQYNSAMALMEITAVAEEDAELRRSAFKPNSPACKAMVDQLLRVIEKADSQLLVPCIKSIGNLARTFKATETRMISPLVKLLDEREAEVSREACIALTKFACSANYIHLDHSKAIISAGGVKHLVQLVYFGEQIVQSCALILLSYIAMHVPDSKELAQAKVLTVLEWASKQAILMQVEDVERLLPEAKGKLEHHQSRGSRGYH